MPVVARDPLGQSIAEVTARLVLFSHGGGAQLYVPEVEGAWRYEAAFGGGSVMIPAELGARL